jgi:hypothetical protein
VEDPAHRDDPARNWDVDALGCTLGVYYRVDASAVVDLQAALRDTGAVYVSATAHEGWDVAATRAPRRHADVPDIVHVARPRQPGVHAFALVGYDEEGFLVQNSWGPRWGAQGLARLPSRPGSAHGEDAWAFTLGVPGAAQAAARAREGAAPARAPRHWVPPSGGPAQARQALQRPPGAVGWTGRRTPCSASCA